MNWYICKLLTRLQLTFARYPIDVSKRTVRVYPGLRVRVSTILHYPAREFVVRAPQPQDIDTLGVVFEQPLILCEEVVSGEICAFPESAVDLLTCRKIPRVNRRAPMRIAGLVRGKLMTGLVWPFDLKWFASIRG